jgi:3-hydroxyisobutyrate dehydrogenase
MSTPTKIAFFGLGTMGGGMARRLLGAGFTLAVYNRNPDRAVPLAALGARVAKSPADAAQGADVLIAMLSDDVASREVWLGHHGALAAAAAGSICIECSTLTVPWVRELAADCASRELAFLDTPVTGTKPHAANGELTFFVGGPAATLEAVRPILTPMSKEILHLGPVGSGAAYKLINNFISGVQAAALAEGVALLERSGLDPQKALPLLAGGPAGSPLIKMLCTRHANKDYTPNFQLHLMAKDIAYALAEGKHHGLTLQTATAALYRFTQASKAGLGNEDMAALLKFMQQGGIA